MLLVEADRIAKLHLLPDHLVSMSDPHNLERFVDAQYGVYEDVCAELRAGSKRSHCMWFIFPQTECLGMSAASKWFAISSLREAEAYLQHPIPGPGLGECTQLGNLVEGRSILEIFDSPDHLKFRSCMTLFVHATLENRLFHDALEKYCGGDFDPIRLGSKITLGL